MPPLRNTYTKYGGRHQNTFARRGPGIVPTDRGISGRPPVGRLAGALRAPGDRLGSGSTDSGIRRKPLSRRLRKTWV